MSSPREILILRSKNPNPTSFGKRTLPPNAKKANVSYSGKRKERTRHPQKKRKNLVVGRGRGWPEARENETARRWKSRLLHENRTKKRNYGRIEPSRKGPSSAAGKKGCRRILSDRKRKRGRRRPGGETSTRLDRKRE